MQEQNKSLLTIAIPTYKRPARIRTLLPFLVSEIQKNRLSSQVTISISDNSDDTETEQAVATVDKGEVTVAYHRQEINVFLDGNLRYLYKNCTTDYIWFFSDDDIPYEGSIVKLVKSLAVKPDVFISSFTQPPGSTNWQFKYPEELHLVKDPEQMVRSFLVCPKLSIFVLKKVNFSQVQLDLLDASAGGGWLFLIMSLTVLEVAENPVLAIHSEPLATCDDDYRNIWLPSVFLLMYKIGAHPFAKKNVPALEEELKVEGYRQSILFSWAIETGRLFYDNRAALRKFIGELEWKWNVLLKDKKLFTMFVLMKAGLAEKYFYKKTA